MTFDKEFSSSRHDKLLKAFDYAVLSVFETANYEIIKETIPKLARDNPLLLKKLYTKLQQDFTENTKVLEAY
jgi:hypothetical protein